MDVFPTGHPEMTVEVAWEAMVVADKERDMDDFKTAFFAYCKSSALSGNPVDLVDLENGFRSQNMRMHLIAKVCLENFRCL